MCAAIRVDGLSKSYRLGTSSAGYGRLTESLQDGVMRLVRRSDSVPRHEEIWALKDVSFEVEEGEMVGVIGQNGAGKTTLLKLLSRITEPTQGRAEVNGRVGSLLEVGTGFHLELTGRENIWLSGAILGMRKREIQRKFDEIVDFSGIDRFIDTPVKRYSSGMHVRLAFSVAAHLQPEILLIDEVLAVGDQAFQKKCLGKMDEVTHEGRTVLFVSHHMGPIRSLCPRAIWLRNGQIAAEGPTEDVVDSYLDSMLSTEKPKHTGNATGQRNLVEIERVRLLDAAGRPASRFPYGADISVEISFSARERVEKPNFWVGIGSERSIFSAINLLDDAGPAYIEGRGKLVCTFRDVPLLPRFYNVFMGVGEESAVSDLVPAHIATHLEIVGNAEEIGLAGPSADVAMRTCAPVLVPYAWRHPDGTEIEVDTHPLTGSA